MEVSMSEVRALYEYTDKVSVLDVIKYIKTLEYIIEIKETERREWADLSIKKQARIEVLENLVKLIQKEKI